MTLVGSWAGVGETDSVVRQGASGATSKWRDVLRGGASNAHAPPDDAIVLCCKAAGPLQWLGVRPLDTHGREREILLALPPAPRKSRSGSLVLSALAPPRLQKVSANRARGPDQEKKAPTVCRACLSCGLEITALTVPFNYTETYCQKYLVLELSRGG